MLYSAVQEAESTLVNMLETNIIVPSRYKILIDNIKKYINSFPQLSAIYNICECPNLQLNPKTKLVLYNYLKTMNYSIPFDTYSFIDDLIKAPTLYQQLDIILTSYTFDFSPFAEDTVLNEFYKLFVRLQNNGYKLSLTSNTSLRNAFSSREIILIIKENDIYGYITKDTNNNHYPKTVSPVQFLNEIMNEFKIEDSLQNLVNDTTKLRSMDDNVYNIIAWTIFYQKPLPKQLTNPISDFISKITEEIQFLHMHNIKFFIDVFNIVYSTSIKEKTTDLNYIIKLIEKDDSLLEGYEHISKYYVIHIIKWYLEYKTRMLYSIDFLYLDKINPDLFIKPNMINSSEYSPSYLIDIVNYSYVMYLIDKSKEGRTIYLYDLFLFVDGCDKYIEEILRNNRETYDLIQRNATLQLLSKISRKFDILTPDNFTKLINNHNKEMSNVLKELLSNFQANLEIKIPKIDPKLFYEFVDKQFPFIRKNDRLPIKLTSCTDYYEFLTRVLTSAFIPDLPKLKKFCNDLDNNQKIPRFNVNSKEIQQILSLYLPYELIDQSIRQFAYLDGTRIPFACIFINFINPKQENQTKQENYPKEDEITFIEEKIPKKQQKKPEILQKQQEEKLEISKMKQETIEFVEEKINKNLQKHDEISKKQEKEKNKISKKKQGNNKLNEEKTSKVQEKVKNEVVEKSEISKKKQENLVKPVNNTLAEEKTSKNEIVEEKLSKKQQKKLEKQKFAVYIPSKTNTITNTNSNSITNTNSSLNSSVDLKKEFSDLFVSFMDYLPKVLEKTSIDMNHVPYVKEEFFNLMKDVSKHLVYEGETKECSLLFVKSVTLKVLNKYSRKFFEFKKSNDFFLFQIKNLDEYDKYEITRGTPEVVTIKYLSNATKLPTVSFDKLKSVCNEIIKTQKPIETETQNKKDQKMDFKPYIGTTTPNSNPNQEKQNYKPYVPNQEIKQNNETNSSKQSNTISQVPNQYLVSNQQTCKPYVAANQSNAINQENKQITSSNQNYKSFIGTNQQNETNQLNQSYKPYIGSSNTPTQSIKQDPTSDVSNQSYKLYIGSSQMNETNSSSQNYEPNIGTNTMNQMNEANTLNQVSNQNYKPYVGTSSSNVSKQEFKPYVGSNVKLEMNPINFEVLNDHTLFITEIEGKLVSNFSQIMIKFPEFTSFQVSPLNIKIKTDLNNLNVKLETQFQISVSQQNNFIVLTILTQFLPIGTSQLNGTLIVNNNIFPFLFILTKLQDFVYIQIKGESIIPDSQHNCPKLIKKLILSETPIKVETYNSLFQKIEHKIISGSNQNSIVYDEKSKESLVFPESKLDFMTVHLSFYQLYSNFLMEYDVFKRPIYFYYYDFLQKKFVTPDTIFVGNLGFRHYFYINTFFEDDKADLQVDINIKNDKDLLFIKNFSRKDYLFYIDLLLNKYTTKTVEIEFVLSSKLTKTVLKRYTVKAVPAIISFDIKGDQVCAKWSDERLNETTIQYFVEKTKKWYIFAANKYVRIPEYKFIVISPYCYNWISFREKNIETYIDFKFKNIFPDNVTNFCYFCITNDNKSKVVMPSNYDKNTTKILVSRLCDEPYNPNETSELWNNVWVPLSEDIRYVKEILNLLSFEDVFNAVKHLLNFIHHANPRLNEMKTKNQIIDYVFGLFKSRIEALEMTKYQLRLPMKIDFLFKTQDFLVKDYIVDYEQVHEFQNNCEETEMKFRTKQKEFVNSDVNDNDTVQLSSTTIGIMKGDIIKPVSPRFEFNFGNCIYSLEKDIDLPNETNWEYLTTICKKFYFVLNSFYQEHRKERVPDNLRRIYGGLEFARKLPNCPLNFSFFFDLLKTKFGEGKSNDENEFFNKFIDLPKAPLDQASQNYYNQINVNQFNFQQNQYQPARFDFGFNQQNYSYQQQFSQQQYPSQQQNQYNQQGNYQQQSQFSQQQQVQQQQQQNQNYEGMFGFPSSENNFYI
ncbi:hypothetical protein TVAG_158110 [Trichomonas vaginalis G3]|uniref:Uncharacterized protein n=1 Tax=Trichomonas vaginalis (strain ATCC PRA-98 / G3) TaxID=412133 RepID=A2F9Q9_TRIV3|nr:hypothetical protein TVAGG3_0783650 [Trichomonas vaginalis G3]EAX98351.1 hypothetical protein TVAG_158110 [Trichomonas vaginalis G3]KAI5495231.1 hypothetical protein TVAGG3_0783650 [Trichomonas vaginalis G3]|eukprot:XP_001311281.1 hypothetical protein [Trichomonas vaginalis G3]